MNFGNWDNTIHNDYEQIKRIGFTKRIKAENVTVNIEEKTATIIGTDATYKVTLNSCTCSDFSLRHLPCKHIYRLAFELELLDDLPEIDPKNSKAFKNSIPKEIERFKEMYFNGSISLDKFDKIVKALQSKC